MIDILSTSKNFNLLVISRKSFKDAAIEYPNQADALDRAYKVLKTGDFNRPENLREFFHFLIISNTKTSGEIYFSC